MKMRFHPTQTAAAACIALAGLAAGAPSVLAAEAEIYGLVDVGVKYAHETGSDSTFEMNAGQISGSRFGLRVSETISPDLSVYVNIENGFDSDTGALADEDRLFNRNSVLGLKTKFGNFEFGRTGALAAGVTGGIFANKVSPFGITWQEAQDSQLLSGADGTRLDNMIRYESPSMSGLTLYAQASNGVSGDDGAASSQKDRYAAVGAVYKNGPLMITAVVDRMFTKNTTADAYNLDDYSTYNLGGTYDFGSAKLFAAYQYGDGVKSVGKLDDLADKPMGFDTNAFILGANIDCLGGTLKTAAGYAAGKGDYTTDDAAGRKTGRYESDGFQFALGYLYPLSKRTNLYAAGACVHISNDDSPVNGSTTSETKHRRSFIMGMRHTL